MRDLMISLVVAIAGAIVGAIFFEGGRLLLHRHRSTRTERRVAAEPLTGIWIESIDATMASLARKDDVTCIQNGSFASGSIARYEPNTQSHRSYDFFGTVEGRAFYGAFWPTNTHGDRGSYGSFFLWQHGPNEWRGSYVSLLEESGTDRRLSTIRPFVDTGMKWTLKQKKVAASDVRNARVVGGE